MYLFSTLDAPCDTYPSSTFAADSTDRAAKTSEINSSSKVEPNQDVSQDNTSVGPEEEEETDQDEVEDEEYTESESKFRPNIPTIMPIRRYVGARNMETVKDGKLVLQLEYCLGA